MPSDKGIEEQKRCLLRIRRNFRVAGRKLHAQTLRELYGTRCLGVADHQLEIFLFDEDPANYPGRLHYFNRCPRVRPDCNESGCGGMPFLKRIPGFRLGIDALAPDKTAVHYLEQPQREGSLEV